MDYLTNELNNFALTGEVIPLPFIDEAQGIKGYTRALSRGYLITNLDDMATLYNSVYTESS